MPVDYGQVTERHGTKFKAVGITLLVFACLSFALDIVGIVLWVEAIKGRGGYISINPPGIYVGILGIIAGSLSIRTSKFATGCSVIAGLVFGIPLIPGSIYMAYVEGYLAALASLHELYSAMAAHLLALICGIGMFATDIIFIVYTGISLSVG